MASRRFSLAGFLLAILLIALLLGLFVPVYRLVEHSLDPSKQVAALAMSADGDTLAAMFEDGSLRICEAPNVGLTIAAPSESGRIALSADGNLVAVAGNDFSTTKSVVVLDTVNGKTVKEFTASPGSLIEFSPADARLAIASSGSVIVHSSRDEGLPPLRLPIGAEEPLATAFSPDGRILAVTTDDGRVRLFDSMTGLPRRQWKLGPAWRPSAMAFSPDGRDLAIRELPGGFESLATRIEVYHLDSLKSVTIPLGDEMAWDSALAYLPGGKLLAVVNNGQLRVFDSVSHQPVDLEKRGDELTLGMAASRHGDVFAVADQNGIELRDCVTLRTKTVLWPGPPPPNFLLIGIGYLLWLAGAVWLGLRRNRRTCPNCGRSYQPLKRKETSTECPECRERALYQTLTAEKIALAQRQKLWRGLRTLLVISCLSACPVAFVLFEITGLRIWLAYLIGLLVVFVAIMACAVAYGLNLRRKAAQSSGQNNPS